MVIKIGKIIPGTNLDFDPPFDEARGNDWVLVVEKESADYIDPKVLNDKTTF